MSRADTLKGPLPLALCVLALVLLLPKLEPALRRAQENVRFDRGVVGRWSVEKFKANGTVVREAGQMKSLGYPLPVYISLCSTSGCDARLYARSNLCFSLPVPSYYCERLPLDQRLWLAHIGAVYNGLFGFFTAVAGRLAASLLLCALALASWLWGRRLTPQSRRA